MEEKKSKTDKDGKKKSSWKPKFFKSSTVASTAIQKPISKIDGKKRKNQKNEIFVDIFEKLTVSINSQSSLLDPIQFEWACY